MSFEISFLIFLAIIFVSETISTFLKSKIPMALIMGAIFIAGFASGILPTDMIKSSNMIAVGTIAFNVLVIHGGTMINVFFIKKNYKSVLLCLGGVAALVGIVGFGMSGVLGREIALLSPGAIIGGGAACAIESRWVLDVRPELSVYPWLIFMFQGIFSVPLVTYALKKEAALVSLSFNPKEHKSMTPKPFAEFGPCSKIPIQFKKTSYYLLSIMLVAVLNKWLHAAFLAELGININITALLLGFILGNIGILDKAPLMKSDSFGLLMLGLMGLMANTLANNTLGNILRLLPPLLMAFVVSTAILAAIGIFGAKYIGCSPYRGMALTLNCMMGYPVNELLISHASRLGKSVEEQSYIRDSLTPTLVCGTMVISNSLAIILGSIMVGLV